ncbi:MULTISPECIES: DUF4097 family beta strand repeat-containing protein [Paenibacillus]|uniref:DUF4097 family beta strand repeat-containing protein n=1 Tax=Paenibacillus TaxID=44249 RepID=UPI0022B90AC7|nr:DUF4097 family beta strand repeat-containing protein [Paenibacillus caseinilyticus]MCZ8520680.1 DUF4097 family beta strand repeat-containing protein [Paenibacillus caseinilyticus]
MKKRNTKSGLLLLAGGILMLVFILTKEGWAQIPVSFSLNTKEVRMEKTADPASIEHIKINSGSTDVRVVPGSSDEIRTRLEGKASPAYAEKLRLDVKPQGETLQIDVSASDSFQIGINLTELDLIVELPEKDWKSVSVRTQSGDAELAGLKGAKVEAEAGSGDIETKGIEAAQLKLRTSSGNIGTEEFKGEELAFRAESGDVSLTGVQSALKGSAATGTITVRTEELLYPADLTTGSGDVIVQPARQPGNLSVDFRGGSGTGKIQWEGFTYRENNEEGDRIAGVFGAGEIPLKVHTSSGDFTLRRE